MADKLQVWKQALVHLEKSTIDTLTDDVEAVHVFNNAWDGAVEEAFSSGDWNFAKFSVALSADSLVTPAVGWSYAFNYPSDWIRTLTVSNSPDFRSVFRDYVDQAGRLYSNTNVLFLRYISSALMADNQIGMWPVLFWRYVALKLAFDTCGRLTSGDTLEAKIEKRMDKALRQAKNIDARNENNKVVPPGSWIRSRLGGYGPLGSDRGGTIIGGEIVLGDGDV